MEYKCRQCGQPILFQTARCPYCERMRGADEQREAGQRRVQYNAAGAGCLAELAKPLRKLLKAFGILLAISAVIWMILFFVFDVYKINYTVADEAARTAEEFEFYLLNLDNKWDVWEIQYDKKNAGILGRLAFWEKASCTIRYNKGVNASYTTFIFEGENLGTGLPDGTYILTKVDFADVLIDKNNKRIYKADSKFYQTYAPKLQAITHDALLGVIMEQSKGGEHGLVETDPPTEAIFTEKAAITARLVRNNPEALMDQGFEARVNSGGDEWGVYKFTYYYSSAVQDLNIAGYTYAD